ncbi:glycosyltransferase [Paenibacillus sp. HJL G12]|uniref:Glycosyltransferase n=1 Tax=Paenibacillus dendrobii TaxID=2691084 RepID=A0A7X3IMW0_9BACL|nr:glycosyltransferase family 2 protein [Paenibacillus dendrobii]MWV46854.1 glycosyltransferase [Paenibacillus dendrobii]
MKRVLKNRTVKPVRRSTIKNINPDRSNSYRRGYERGYEQGVEKGKEAFGQPFHGTSIVIPSYNQAEYLARCIDSIETHTAEPYEIIVVDNGSTDETATYLGKRSGHLRFKRLENNRGFAGGVNQGLMMAKGDTIVILNNDTLVTPNWLTCMMRCLESDPLIGAVGPVTNYISGEQQIVVPYEHEEQMWEYAAARGGPDDTKWKQTDRLVGFCVLFKREVLEQIGYFDEGFRIGNYEDDDWIIRLRLCGLKLVIAGDSFIHHFGSVSMKNLGQEQFHAVHGHNELYYTGKWGNPHAWVDEVRHNGLKYEKGLSPGTDSSPADFFPSHVLVGDQGGRQFLLYKGSKYPCIGMDERAGIRPVVLSRMDIRRIPTAGTAMSELEVLSILTISGSELVEGQLVSTGEGTVYQWSQGEVLRPFVSDCALERWNMEARGVIRLSPEKLNSIPRGLPIIAPPMLQNPDL